MDLTSEQVAIGRRNFLKALAGTPALAALGAAAELKGPVRGGPVRVGFIGVGAQGRVLLTNTDSGYADVRALCDINPASLAKADEVLAKHERPKARHYVEWRDMLEHEDLEAIITAVPLWMHAEVVAGCLDAGKHVLCEKMMAWDLEGCQRMLGAAEKSGRVLEIGYQRWYNPIYQAAYDGVIKPGVLGDIYHTRLVWHRNQNWRRPGDPPSPGYDASKWGYPTWDHLWNWRLYWRYSQGLFAELCSHQLNVVNWFYGTSPTSVQASGGLYRFKDGRREVYDHVYALFDYPGGRNAVFTSVESNAFDQRYEMFMGTKGTLILRNETEALMFDEGAGSRGAGSRVGEEDGNQGAGTRATGIEVSPRTGAAALDASESRPPEAASASRSVASGGSGRAMTDRPSATRNEIARFCEAVRVHRPIACGPEKALHSAKACMLANQAIQKHAILKV